jgi:subtilase family serine protease
MSIPIGVMTLALAGAAAQGADFDPSGGSRSLITQRVDQTKLSQMPGNTRREVSDANDRGQVDDSLPMEHMILVLARPQEQEQAVRQLIDDLHNPASAKFHQWLTPNQFGQAYGPSATDIRTIVSWLTASGFTVNSVAPGGMTIDFSGTAGAVHKAFHAEIHHLDVDGASHVANVNDPSIPEALAPAVTGIASLHDFVPRAKRRLRADYTISSGAGSEHAVVPGDLATIYDIAPLFAAGYSGQGQTIALIEDTDLYSSADWSTFRSVFGLSKYSSGSLATVHPKPASGGAACSDPGVVAGDAEEAILDAEWASAAAPSAAIVIASCANTRTTFGGLIALQNLVNGTSPPPIVSISYGECEAQNGVAANAAFNAIYQQAAAEGISVFVAAGDEGAASCDAGASVATHGIGVSGFASTPYNVAVGGTDFGDTVAGTTATYWNTSNSATYASARSYIPEIPWNDSCASQILATYYGYSTAYGSSGFCASGAAQSYGLLEVAAGSGGPSGCATGTPTTSGVVGGSCAGYKKPSWQAGTGVPADGVRGIPDLSLFAADGVWGHYYVVCYSNRRDGGVPCTGSPSQWPGGGGTSFASPIMAGIQALVNQKAGGPQGNPNYVYYKLATLPGAVCKSSANGSGCIFHNITSGDIDVDCDGSLDCYGATAAGFARVAFARSSRSAAGALSVSNASYQAAYGANAGWNFATGLGSVDAYNLVMGWASGR